MRKSNTPRPAHRRASHSCRQIFALLSEYVDGKLPLRDCAQFEKHMGGCAPCRAFVQSLKQSVELCARYRDERLDPKLAAHTRRLLLAACRKAGVGERNLPAKAGRRSG